MNLANALNIAVLSRNNHEFKEFFDGFGNCLNSCLCFLFCFILLSFGVYYHIRIHISQCKFKKNPEEKDRFQNLLEALHCKDIYSSLYNILFLYRRTLTALCLVFMSNYPSVQIQALLVMALLTMWYIAYHNPFVERKLNYNEIFNEICVVLCIYTVMLMMMTYDIKILDILTIQFIVIVAINILYFGVQLVPELILGLWNLRSNKQKVKK